MLLSKAGILRRIPRSVFNVFNRQRYSGQPPHVQDQEELNEVMEAPKSSTDPGRLLIGFTCKICQTRTHRTMSKLSYTKGIVLIECPGCASRHLIADHLGWFEAGQKGHANTVEEMMKKKGEEVKTFWRVDEQGNKVFEWNPQEN